MSQPNVLKKGTTSPFFTASGERCVCMTTRTCLQQRRTSTCIYEQPSILLSVLYFPVKKSAEVSSPVQYCNVGNLFLCIPLHKHRIVQLCPSYLCVWVRGLDEFLTRRRTRSLVHRAWTVLKINVPHVFLRLCILSSLRSDSGCSACSIPVRLAHQVGVSANLSRIKSLPTRAARK